MTTLDPRGLEAAAEAVGRHIHYSRLSHNCHRCRRTAESAVTAYLDVAHPVVETVQALKDLPVGVVVRSAAGTIACRADECNGVVFGDERPFPWTSLMLPARVIWRPHD